GLACLQWAENNKRALPPAVLMNYAQWGNWGLMSDATQPFGPNWAIFILPYVEQEPLYKLAQPDLYRNSGVPGYQAWRNIRGAKIPVYLCPSDPGNQDSGTAQVGGGWARGNYAANAGPGYWPDTVDGRGSNIEINWGSGNWIYSTPVMGINFGEKISTIVNGDGTSNTIMVNEVRVGLDGRDIRGSWAMGMPGASITAANAWGDSVVPNDANDASDDIQWCDQFYGSYPNIGSKLRMGCWTGCWNWQAQARSGHTNGVNACFVDGHVQFVPDQVDNRVWAYMLAPRDGRTFEWP